MRSIDRWLMTVVAMLLVSSVLFSIYPQVDIKFSQLFWRGDHFLFMKQGVGRFFTVYLHSGMRWAFFIGLILYPVLSSYGQGNIRVVLRNTLFIILAASLAAGLMTNVILKDHWGRARPVQIEQFGGDRQFTAAWEISNQCRKNCSFVGGDVSFAFCLLAPALLVKRCRKLVVTAVCIFGTIVALGRIAAGAHFLSDCAIGALLTIAIVLGLYRVRIRIRI